MSYFLAVGASPNSDQIKAEEGQRLRAPTVSPSKSEALSGTSREERIGEGGVAFRSLGKILLATYGHL